MSKEVVHAISISCEQPSRSGALVLLGGHRAHCSCGWSSDCYAQMSDTQRAVEVHLRRAKREDLDALISRSTIGAANDDVTKRGIDAHLRDLEREMKRCRPKKARRRTPTSNVDAAFMRGFGAALASIWHCQRDRQLIRQLLTANNFKLSSFRGVGMLPADLATIRRAVHR